VADLAGTASSSRTWQVGNRKVSLAVSRPGPLAPIQASMHWAPNAPSSLSAEEWRQYRAGRDQALAEISRELGINAAVLEV